MGEYLSQPPVDVSVPCLFALVLLMRFSGRSPGGLLRKTLFKIREMPPITAYGRAKKLLFGMLTPDQQQRAKKTQWILERGRFGTFELPLETGRIKFTPYPDAVAKLRPRHPVLAGYLRYHDHAPFCVNFTALHQKSPWHDAVATLLLYIRAGKEEEIFKRGNL